MPSFISSSAILASTLFSAVHAYGVGQRSGGQNLAVYWGQGSGQKSLGSFCADSTIDIIPIGFVNVFPDENGTYGYPGTNFGNACGGAYIDSKNETTQLLGSCPQIGADITYCQSQGKKILLSLGGGSTGVFVASDDSAVAFGDFLHGAFGPPSSSWTGPRPFGDACVDGFDFDIEASATDIPVALGAHYATMVNHLRTLGVMMITASPQCIVPDANMGDALANANFDAIFVQFYNTPQCSARAFFDNTYGAYGGPATNISYDSWISWMQANSKNPNTLVYLGLPAAPGATYGEMYLTTTEAQEIITYFQGKYPLQFGGAMLWEATFSDNNQVNGMSYAANVKSFLIGSSGTSTTTNVPSATPTNSANSTYTSPTFAPTGTGSYSYPGSIGASGSGYPSGGPTVSPTATTDAYGSPSTYTPTNTGNTYTGKPTSSPSSVGPITYTDSNGNTHSYTPSQGPTTSSSNPVVTATDRNGNTYTYTSTNIQPTGTSSSNLVVTATDRNGNTYTYTSTNIQPTGTSSSNPIVTATDRNGNTYTYTSTNIQPAGTSYSTWSSMSGDDWSAWDPTSTIANPISSSSSLSTSAIDSWTAWDPTSSSSTVYPISTSSASQYWSNWDPSTSYAPTSTSTSSTGGWVWHFSSSTTSSISYEATITATDAITMTIMPLPASSHPTPSIAVWSSYWTQRESLSSTPAGGFFTHQTSAASTPGAPVATSSESASKAWSFTGWASMPAYSTLAPLPSIATVAGAAGGSAVTSAGAVGATASASAAPTQSVGVYVQPAPFTGAGSLSKPAFVVLAAVILGAVAVIL